MKTCNFCGNEIGNDEDLFCSKCGTKTNAVKEDGFNTVKNSNPIKKEVFKKKLFWIISVSSIFLCLLLVFISVFTNWISFTDIYVYRYSYNVYDLMYGFDISHNTGIISSISTLSYIVSLARGSTSFSSLYFYVFFPFVFIILIQISLLVLVLVFVIKMILITIKKKQIPSSCVNVLLVFILLYSLTILLIGSVSFFVVLVLVLCILSYTTVKVFNYIENDKKIKIEFLISNILASFTLIVSFFLLTGFSRLAVIFGEDTHIASGIVKFYYVNDFIGGGKGFYANYFFYIVTIPFLLLFGYKRLASMFGKVNQSVKIIGWILVGLLFVLAVTNFILGRNIKYSSESPYVHYGTTAAIFILILATQIADSIKINKKVSAEIEISKPSLGEDNLK
ncbi:MAG: hypothetical protein LBV51_00120 [Acholeplasmatales bacterium]|nr:hypothetical protein [Acholeplasmatales bacterium]